MGEGEVRISCHQPEHCTGETKAWDCGAGKLQQTEVREQQTARMSGGESEGNRRGVQVFSDDIRREKQLQNQWIHQLLFVYLFMCFNIAPLQIQNAEQIE